MSDRFLKIADVIGKVGFSQSSIYAMMADGKFPQPIRVLGKSNRWLESDINQWMAEQIQAHRAA